MNMLLHGIDTQWIPQTYNIQMIFNSQISNENRRISLNHALEMLGERALDAHDAHDALNDAKNTASICRHLDMEKGIAEYPSLLIRERGMHNSKERSESAATYSSITEILEDPRQRKFFCPICGNPAECTEFVGAKQKYRSSIGECESGHKILVRFNFEAWPDGMLTVKRRFVET